MTCADSVTSLPPSPLYLPTDPRLLGDAVIVVLKGDRTLGLYTKGKLHSISTGDTQAVACWSIGLGYRYPPGPKRVQGDLKTPEGWYRTSDKPWSAYHGAIYVHYPNAEDAERGAGAGLVTMAQAARIRTATSGGSLPDQGTPLGGDILIHGGGGRSDWTLGCIALDDAHIDLLRTLLPSGMRTDLLILP